MLKICRICTLEKDITLFGVRKNKNRTTYRTECKDCISDFQNRYRQDNKQAIAASKRQWKIDNREHVRGKNKIWQDNNKQLANQLVRQHRLNNLAYYRFKRALRRLKIQEATLSIFKPLIKEFYMNCPQGHHVDHIIPISNPLVCGLHVPWNLQYLTKEENLKKGNKLCLD
jgi:5-methylcytosine-specific restriction endonuclease McrA